MVEFWAISFFYSCNHYFSKIAIFETCHKSIWNFNEVCNSCFEVELGLYEIHLKCNSNGNEKTPNLGFYIRVSVQISFNNKCNKG